MVGLKSDVWTPINGGVCIKHGAKVKVYVCSYEGCTNRAIQGGVCMRHGAKVKLCSSEGCTNQVQRRGVCWRHGAKEKRCSSEGCKNKAIRGGVCWRHGANRTSNDVATAFGSKFDEPTAPFSVTNRNTHASHEQGAGVPTEIFVIRHPRNR